MAAAKIDWQRALGPFADILAGVAKDAITAGADAALEELQAKAEDIGASIGGARERIAKKHGRKSKGPKRIAVTARTVGVAGHGHAVHDAEVIDDERPRPRAKRRAKRKTRR